MRAAVGLVVWAPRAVGIFLKESADALSLVVFGIEVDDDEVILRGKPDIVTAAVIAEIPAHVAIVRIVVPPAAGRKAFCPGPTSSTKGRLPDRRGA